MNIIFIALGGAIGALLRYYVAVLITKNVIGSFPWPTLTVNLIGSLIIGVMWGIAEQSNLSVYIKSFIFVGLLGAFTTFSTFSLDIFNLIRKNEMETAVMYAMISVVLGIFMVGGGYFLAKKIIHLINLWF